LDPFWLKEAVSPGSLLGREIERTITPTTPGNQSSAVIPKVTL